MLEEGHGESFVDGSFNPGTKVYGYGGFLNAGGEKYILQGNGKEPEMCSMRNVAGEILGADAAMKKAKELNLSVLDIYYDYKGIEEWALGRWKRNKVGTKRYKKIYDEYSKSIQIHFFKVKGHSGISGNEEADKLAKEAVGIKKLGE